MQMKKAHEPAARATSKKRKAPAPDQEPKLPTGESLADYIMDKKANFANWLMSFKLEPDVMKNVVTLRDATPKVFVKTFVGAVIPAMRKSKGVNGGLEKLMKASFKYPFTDQEMDKLCRYHRMFEELLGLLVEEEPNKAIKLEPMNPVKDNIP